MLSQALTWLCEPPPGNFTLIWVLRRVCETECLDDQELQSKLLTALAVSRWEGPAFDVFDEGCRVASPLGRKMSQD